MNLHFWLKPYTLWLHKLLYSYNKLSLNIQKNSTIEHTSTLTSTCPTFTFAHNVHMIYTFQHALSSLYEHVQNSLWYQNTHTEKGQKGNAKSSKILKDAKILFIVPTILGILQMANQHTEATPVALSQLETDETEGLGKAW